MSDNGVRAVTAEASEHLPTGDLFVQAIATLDRLAREGHGPAFTQRSIGAGYVFLAIGETPTDLCHSIIALGKMTDKGHTP